MPLKICQSSASLPNSDTTLEDYCSANDDSDPICLIQNPCCNRIGGYTDLIDRRNRGLRPWHRVKRSCCIRDWPGFYASMLPIAETLVRVVVGIMFLMHVSGKFKIGAAAVAADVFAKNGLEPALTFAYVVMCLELVGGACLLVGLFTRFFAAALAIEMLVALLFVHMPKGYAAGGGGYEYVLLIGAACLFFRDPRRRHLLDRPVFRQRALKLLSAQPGYSEPRRIPHVCRNGGAMSWSRCRPPIKAAPHTAAAAAASAAASVKPRMTALWRALAAASRNSETTCKTRRSASAAGKPVRVETSRTR